MQGGLLVGEGRPHRSRGRRTHIAQVQELSLVGQAEEGGADDQMNLQKRPGSVPGPGGVLWAGVPGPAPSAPLTCRVGSRVAKWESCSLKALSFSSYWLGEGQAASSSKGGRPSPQGAITPQLCAFFPATLPLP